MRYLQKLRSISWKGRSRVDTLRQGKPSDIQNALHIVLRLKLHGCVILLVVAFGHSYSCKDDGGCCCLSFKCLDEGWHRTHHAPKASALRDAAGMRRRSDSVKCHVASHVFVCSMLCNAALEARQSRIGGAAHAHGSRRAAQTPWTASQGEQRLLGKVSDLDWCTVHVPEFRFLPIAYHCLSSLLGA